MSKEDTYTHKGWLHSDYYFKRLAAVIGYVLAGLGFANVGLRLVTGLISAFLDIQGF